MAGPPTADRPLTARQRRFVEEYLIDLNATQAAIRAGYSSKAATPVASRLLTYANIAAAIAKGQAERAEKTGLTAQWVLERLQENHARAMQAEAVRDREGKETGEYRYEGAVANKALELIGKHLSMFTDNVALKTPDGPLAVVVTRRVIDPAHE